MLNVDEVDRIVSGTLQGILGGKLTGVRSVDSVDWEGHEALRVTIILRDDTAEQITGDEIVTALVRVQQDLQLRGEDRFAYLRWLSERDLADLDDDLDDDDP